mmetsp:Transcript_41641/g.111647  ORF Transcript_41641/g.111647 Transcript_41641/m.111647 type:complete len:170 (-) Transcript_41641:383-892(-)
MEIGDAVKRAEAAFDDADKEHSGSLDCKKLHSVVQSLLANGNLRHELFGQYSVYQEFANSILMSPAASKVSKDKFISWVESRLAAAGVDCCGSGTSTHPDLTSLIAQNQVAEMLKCSSCVSRYQFCCSSVALGCRTLKAIATRSIVVFSHIFRFSATSVTKRAYAQSSD